MLLSVLVLLIGALAVFVIFSTEPSAERGGAVKKTAMLVEVLAAEHGTFTPEFVVTGTVRAERDVELSPQVGGSVVARADRFSPGRFVHKGESLLTIDPAPYRIAVSQRKSALAQTKASFALELGQQDVAQQEYQTLFGRGADEQQLSEEERQLVLRKPQLEAAREQVRDAEEALRQAELELARTNVRAPFDAHVLSRTVDVGTHLSPGTSIGRLVGVETYWVEASVPMHQRRWLPLPQRSSPTDSKSASPGDRPDGKPATDCPRVELENRGGWRDGVTRHGCLARLIGALDASTRMARVLIEVSDPLALETPNPDTPPLVVGEFLETRIPGVPLEGVVRIPRELLRKNNTVWLQQDGKLAIVELSPLLVDARYAYVRDSVKPGAQIVTTHLTSVSDGAALRVAEAEGE